jgi:hypothetical protein
VYKKHEESAAKAVGGRAFFDQLPEPVRWALVDVDFNIRGGLVVLDSVTSKIKSGDYFGAAFALINTKRTVDVQLPRTLACVQYIMLGSGPFDSWSGKFGKIV